MDNTLETSIDLYTLFTDKESLETTIDLLCSELFAKNPDDIRREYLDFNKEINTYFSECDIVFKYLFFGAHLLTPPQERENFNTILEYEHWLMEENKILSPHFVLSMYYTVEYLIENTNCYMYRSYMYRSYTSHNKYLRIENSEWESFTPDFRFNRDAKLPTDNNYYNLLRKYRETSKQQQQSTQWTKELNSASTQNPFYPLINYEVTSDPFYFLNGFLPDISAVISNNTAFSKGAYDKPHNLDLQNNNIKSAISEQLTKLFHYFFTCLDNIEIKDISSFADRAIRIMKLEYGMGVITLSNYLEQMAQNRYRPNTFQNWEQLIIIQKEPKFPDRLFYQAAPTNNDIQLLSIGLSKYFLCICYLLCNMDLPTLRESLHTYIDHMYQYHQKFNIAESDTSSNNLWYTFYCIDDILCDNIKRNQYLNKLENSLKIIKEKSWYVDFSKHYWYSRFSDEWWQSTRQLYDIPIIELLKTYIESPLS